MKKELESVKSRWWEPIKDAFGELELRGLRVVCPKCKKNGLVTTRWIKGPTLKPIFILHINEDTKSKVCELDDEQQQSIRHKVLIFESDIRNLLNSRIPYVLFSGGKDSVATLYYLKNIAKNSGYNLTAIYVDTTAGLSENMDYVKEVCGYLKVELEIVRPKVDYFTLAKKWGIPSFRYRWCCRELKIKPISEFLKSRKEAKIVFDGIRAAESNVRKHYIPIWYHPGFGCLSVSPIFYWSDKEVSSFINSNGIPKTLLHRMGTSTECWCGAYKTEKDFIKLYELDKGIFYKLAEIEEENDNRFTFLYKDGKKTTLKGLEKQILKGKKKIELR